MPVVSGPDVDHPAEPEAMIQDRDLRRIAKCDEPTVGYGDGLADRRIETARRQTRARNQVVDGHVFPLRASISLSLRRSSSRAALLRANG